jgi:membrane protein DedA with SNARE-associated domain
VSAGHVIALIAAAALLVLVVTKRKRLGGERVITGTIVALLLIVYGTGATSHLPKPDKIIEDIADALGQWTYALVGVMAFLETGAFVGLVAPGEFTVIVGGVVAGQGTIALIPLIGIAWASCILGDTASFFVGRRLGRQFLLKHGPRFKITHDRLEKVESYFDRHGGKTVLIGRFIGLVRAVAPFIAGSSGMAYRAFIPFSVIGTGLWATAYTLLGYFFYRSFEKVAAVAGRVTLVFGTLVALVVGIVWLTRTLRDPDKREQLRIWLDKQEQHPPRRPFVRAARVSYRRIARPFAHKIAPQVRFLWNRITPGGLGIELTTALASLAVGSYVFVLTVMKVTDDVGPTVLDNKVADLVDRIRMDWLETVAKWVTFFGTSTVTGVLVLVALVALVWRRRPVEAGTLAIGSILTFVGVHVTKAAVDRPRAADSLVETVGSSFPSGHAAYSVVYVALGVIAARVLPGLVSQAALVTGTVIWSALIGCSRVYLGAHYWSDVVGGWALAATVFAACGTIGLIVAYVRQNGRRSGPSAARPATAVDPG